MIPASEFFNSNVRSQHLSQDSGRLTAQVRRGLLLGTRPLQSRGSAKQEKIRISERVKAGLQRARKDGVVLGRKAVNRAADPDAAKIRELRNDGQSFGEIAEELGRSQSDVYRVCMTLGFASI
jgi:hypothetical protein